ncbi:MAG: NAD(P)/FAD-dependent oxidoreductase [Anaerolineae bacterium]|nr:NAD(P)/FAD-dependent oxidoreductase [Anaerolineae bacterium]
MKRYVIIGTGVAGISATEAIRTQDTLGKIVLIGDEPEVYYSRPGLAYVLSGEVPEPQLYPFTEEDFTRLNVELITDRVTKIDRETGTISLQGGARSHTTGC